MSTIGSGKSDLGRTVDFSSDQMKSAADWLGPAWHRGERYRTGGLQERISASRTINPLLTSQVPDETSNLPTLREIMDRVHDTAKRKQSPAPKAEETASTGSLNSSAFTWTRTLTPERPERPDASGGSDATDRVGRYLGRDYRTYAGD